MVSKHDDPQAYGEFEDMPIFQDENNERAINLLRGIIAYGFEKPSVIQQKAIVPLALGRNVIGQSQSGTGKTGAFVIGSLMKYDPEDPHVQLIYVAHTRELAQQIIHVIENIGEKLLKKGTTVELCVGQLVCVTENIEHIRNGTCQIIVGTPGRISDLVSRTITDKKSGQKQRLVDPAHVRMIILDEADCLLSQGFYDGIADIVRYLDDPEYRQDYLQIGIFSATISDEILQTARALCMPGPQRDDDPRAPVEVLVPVEQLTLEGIEQYYWNLDSRPNAAFSDKVDFIIAVNGLRVIPQCIIYVNKKDTAEQLCHVLNDRGLDSRYIYGKMSPSDRMATIAAFRKGMTRILVSTDLLSRGLDIQQIAMVINFDLPYVLEKNSDINKERMAEYLHRIGRSGRFGRKGLAINLISNVSEKYRLEKIEEYYGTEIKQLPDQIGLLY